MRCKTSLTNSPAGPPNKSQLEFILQIVIWGHISAGSCPSWDLRSHPKEYFCKDVCIACGETWSDIILGEYVLWSEGVSHTKTFRYHLAAYFCMSACRDPHILYLDSYIFMYIIAYEHYKFRLPNGICFGLSHIYTYIIYIYAIYIYML